MRYTDVTCAFMGRASDETDSFYIVGDASTDKRCRLRSVSILSKYGAGDNNLNILEMKSGGSGGTTKLKLKFTNAIPFTPVYFSIPYNGILFEESIYCALSGSGDLGITSMTITYEGEYESIS